MKAKEIMEDATVGTTASSSVATVSAPLGAIQRRIPEPNNIAKYSNRPANDYASPKRKKNAR